MISCKKANIRIEIVQTTLLYSFLKNEYIDLFGLFLFIKIIKLLIESVLISRFLVN